MNTAELYVEPILVGALVIALLSLPLAPEILEILRSELFKSFAGVALGAILVGLIYFVGIVADRLIDSCLEALERHNRVRYALGTLDVPQWLDIYNAEHREDVFLLSGSGDLFPEDELRWRVFTDAARIADSLDYIRTRVRLLRALTFLLPGLVFAGALGALRLMLTFKCAGPSGTASPPGRIRCDQTDWIVSLSVGEAAFPVFVAPIVYVFVILAAAVLRVWGASQWRKNKVPCCGGVWAPPNTRRYWRVTQYAKYRGWPVAELSNRRLWLDIVRQPVVWGSVLLLLGSSPAIWLLSGKSVLAGVAGVATGLLLTAFAGWAWWRITGTYMAYLRGAGRFLRRTAASADAGS